MIEKRALVVDDRIEPRLSCYLTLSFDRRLMGGAQAGKIFDEICDLVRNPSKLD
jgi:pyruvate/2-oxoglutarate dehydrogenase complex dihydrolipoamide acyltransferase (E2) component